MARPAQSSGSGCHCKLFCCMCRHCEGGSATEAIPMRERRPFTHSKKGFPFHPSRKQPPFTHGFVIARQVWLCKPNEATFSFVLHLHPPSLHNRIANFYFSYIYTVSQLAYIYAFGLWLLGLAY